MEWISLYENIVNFKKNYFFQTNRTTFYNLPGYFYQRPSMSVSNGISDNKDIFVLFKFFEKKIHSKFKFHCSQNEKKNLFMLNYLEIQFFYIYSPELIHSQYIMSKSTQIMHSLIWFINERKKNRFNKKLTHKQLHLHISNWIPIDS